VMTMLRESCKTVAALSVCISRIRSAIIPKLLMPTCEALYPYMLEDGVASFMSASLAEKVTIQRAHRVDHCWSFAAEIALKSLNLLPANVEGLKLTEMELVQLSRVRESALINKQEVVHVYAAGTWLEHVISLARTSDITFSFARLALPLLILSGRRTTEIMNGKSTFLPSPMSTTTAWFTGQIKRRGAETSYEIPLLCDYDTFAYCLAVLREKQKGEQLDAIACNNRYHKSLNIETRRVCPQAKSVHSFRAMYGTYAFHLYKTSVTFNRCLMLILGHEKLGVSLSYNNWVLHGMEAFYPGCMGELPQVII
jgi:hypothetical protein